MKKYEVYLDHAATTPIDPEVAGAMKPFMETMFGNPSSFHTPGKVVRDALSDARARVAAILGSRPDEIIFTSGGTEANNLALLGFARKHKGAGCHIISARTEHPSVLEALEHLRKEEGFEVTYVDVDAFGRVDPRVVAEAMRDDTILISVMYANNEIGTISDIRKIGAAVRKVREKGGKSYPIFHTDACQAVGALEVDVRKLNVDMMTVNSSKIYGPKGEGALYVHRSIRLQPLQFGGSQEKRIRPGTENVIGIIGFAKALELVDARRNAESARLIPLRDELTRRILETIPKTRLNGHPSERLPNSVNISFMDVEGEALLLYLDAAGVFAATGSACTSATLDPSHVILALGLPYEVAHGSLRFSLGRSTTQKEIEYVMEVLPPLVEKLRKISPVNVDPKHYT